jgi:hypothetical protein
MTVTTRELAKIVPLGNVAVDLGDERDELFGIWKDRSEMKNVDGYVRKLRKGRNFDN